MSRPAGRIYRVSGPLVVAEGMRGVSVYEVIEIGEEKLIGEAIGVEGDKAIIQVYEDTSGLKVGDPVYPTGHPLSAELGPGLIKSIFDGIQRPLPVLEALSGIFVRKGIKAPPLPRDKKWYFTPLVKPGEKVSEGDFIGYVNETDVVRHYIMVPPGVKGSVEWVAGEGDYTMVEPVARINGRDVTMLQEWPVRRPRPFREKLDPREPFITGVRVIDFLFPLAKGGKAAVPGGFGTGKTVLLHSITKWSEADITIYIGCGERGNEMADALNSFIKLVDPRTGKPMMERSIFIANTSNMPVAAREASVFLGVTIGEYFRDMGYNVLLVADSTSRWAEAMREISGRLEELPGEEGFPAYLASRLAQFYERSGYVKTIGSAERLGSLTIMGAVSPPGADFSEPVTQATLRLIRALYALDVNLAYRRHYPSINWLTSFSLYVDNVREWWSKISPEYSYLREKISWLLQREAELEELVRLVGADALPVEDRLVLEVARMIREDFLQQDAFSTVDAFSHPVKTSRMAAVIVRFYEKSIEAVKQGVAFEKIRSMRIRERIARMKDIPFGDNDKEFEGILSDMENEFKALMEGGR
ncbi:V-type ATP synthase subunit A [Desulfurococcus mucosus]|uniref:A-type ATP synthase subunit A n=1 Tax=Desulfurococcus mucosus (strain ATCC 35584 / DSM 2162 / JCM 9187 / O7/1) TaxID=765177 RepID=E8RAJ0_DESM0|nr:V-type ATP synthase subunit A [Desulfurococcus mucosus]ADV64400.1 H+transporting two-sector ATPase alpha/beta subunit central region [Desulfurococcus mucosus DSM 2162]